MANEIKIQHKTKCKGCGKPIVYGMYCDTCTGLT